MEFIRSNYNRTTDNVTIKLIENLILKFFSSLIQSFETLEEVNCFSLLIADICFNTSDIVFYQKIINILYVTHFYNLDEKNAKNSKLISVFQKYTFIRTFHLICNSFQKEKITFFIEKIYMFFTNKIDYNLLLVLINFLDNLNVTNQLEIVTVVKWFNYADYVNVYPSPVVIDYLKDLCKQPKKAGSDCKNNELNIYEPFIPFKHGLLYNYLLDILENDETNTVNKINHYLVHL